MNTAKMCPAVDQSVLLLIADRADVKTVSTLMQTSKANHALIKRYQRSIIQARLRSLQTIMPPTGVVLSSDTVCQLGVLPAFSFFTVAECERRERHINALFPTTHTNSVSWLLTICEGHPQFAGHPAFVDGLRRACHLTDRIADSEVDIVLRLGPTITFKVSSKQESDEHDFYRYVAHCRVREAQVTFIKRLPLHDLAVLCLLMYVADRAFVKRPDKEYLAADRVSPEANVAFCELVLRHSTFALWGYFGDTCEPEPRRPEHECAELAHHIEWLLDDLVEEIADWENGIGLTRYRFLLADLNNPDVSAGLPITNNVLLPGLHITLMKTFQEKADCSPEEIDAKIVKILTGESDEP